MTRTLIFHYYLSLIILHIALAPLAHGSTTANSDFYQVHYDQNHLEHIHVDARIILEDSLLYMSPFGPMPDRWYDYVRELRVYTEEGREIPTNRSENGGWILEGAKIGQIANLSYDLVLTHEEINWPGGIDGVAYVRDWGILVSGRSLFVMNGQRKSDLKVKFTYPERWKVSIPWSVSSETESTYLVDNLRDLQESLIFAGTHREILLERDGFVLKFILGGDAVLKQEDRYKKVAADVMDYYIEQMGGVPRSASGYNFGQSMVVISASDSVDGEVIGNHISMFMNPEGDDMQQMMGWFMFAHEFFHLWNGKTLRFENTQTDWFKEGISNYYTMKALYQIGFANEQVLLMMLDGLFYQRYINDPGYGTVAPSLAASGFSKDNHWGIIYGGGLFAGIAMDMEIRSETSNTHSLDDLMRFFYEEFGGTDRLITAEDILVNVNRIGDTDFSELLDSSIKGITPVPLSKYLVNAGVEAETGSGHLVLRHKERKTAMETAIWKGFLGYN